MISLFFKKKKDTSQDLTKTGGTEGIAFVSQVMGSNLKDQRGMRGQEVNREYYQIRSQDGLRRDGLAS